MRENEKKRSTVRYTFYRDYSMDAVIQGVMYNSIYYIGLLGLSVRCSAVVYTQEKNVRSTNAGKCPTCVNRKQPTGDRNAAFLGCHAS